ncbi:hypothetical protein ACWGS9_05545 [Bradyrhizobium sp. Arg314]
MMVANAVDLDETAAGRQRRHEVRGTADSTPRSAARDAMSSDRHVAMMVHNHARFRLRNRISANELV